MNLYEVINEMKLFLVEIDVGIGCEEVSVTFATKKKDKETARIFAYLYAKDFWACRDGEENEVEGEEESGSYTFQNGAFGTKVSRIEEITVEEFMRRLTI